MMDGRDIGTVVFPDAELKIFLTADPKVRAARRYEELRANGENVSLARIEENIRSRDEADLGRDISPLRQAPDAIVLDNSNMTLEEQMQWIEPFLRKELKTDARSRSRDCSQTMPCKEEEKTNEVN